MNIKSMTGYGRGVNLTDEFSIIVEIRSVNHKYNELNIHTPRAFAYLEEKIRKISCNYFSRGKTEISVQIQRTKGRDEEIRLNFEIARAYLEILRNANEEFQLTDDLTLSVLSRFPDVFTVVKVLDDETKIWNIVEIAVTDAFGNFLKSREFEGERLYNDIHDRLIILEKMLGIIEIKSPEIKTKYYEKLAEKIKEILSDTSIDESRILTEAAIFAEKQAIDEEIVRFKSHIEQFREQLLLTVPIGRKLDFIVQEMNREINTIGSKSGDIAITRTVVDMKSEIEKIREQIQNVE